MKKWLIFIVILSIIFIGGYLVLSFYAVKFIDARLQKAVGAGLIITEVEIKPTYLSAKGIQYQDPRSKLRILQIEEMRIYPKISSFLKGSLGIREWAILKPTVSIYRSREGLVTGPWVSVGKGEKEGEISGEEGRKEGKAIHMRIDRIRIQEGSLDFEDMKPGGTPANIRLRELDLEMEDIQFPLVSSRSPVEFRGKMKGGTKDGSIDLKGWIDILAMDMEIFLKAEGIDVKVFEPYYRKRVSAEIESAYMNMESKIAVEKRMIDAPGYLELTDLRIKEGGTVLWVPAKTLVSLLKNRGGRVKTNFRVQGSMDDPQFNLQENLLNRIGISLAEALGIPIKVVGKTLFEGTAKGAGGLTEQLKSLGELLKRKKEKGR